MQKAPFIIALGLMLPLMGTNAHAQTPPATPSQQELAPTNPKLNLTLEQRHTIKEIVKDAKTNATPASVQAAVGEPIPQGVSPQPMPTAEGLAAPPRSRAFSGAVCAPCWVARASGNGCARMPPRQAMKAQLNTTGGRAASTWLPAVSAPADPARELLR